MTLGRVLLIGVAAMATVLTGCAEATNTTTVERMAPDRLSPLSADEIRRVETVLRTLPRPGGWLRGVVLEENTKGNDWWRVLSDEGVVVLEPGYCGPGNSDTTGHLLAPGDGIAWSPKGDDGVVCTDQIRVTVVAAVEKAWS